MPGAERDSSRNPEEQGDRLLRVSNLKYSHPDGVKVFDGLDLDVRPGEIVAIMGGSGTGKTTLAELVFKLRSGNVVKGEIAMDMDRSALLLQDAALFEHLTVGKNLALVLRRRGRKADRDTQAGLLERVGLDASFLDRKPDSLSGGQARRVALARALGADPELIYCDEPSAGLDLDAVRQVGHLLRKVVSGGKRGAVIVTHDALLAAVAADRVLLLDQGMLVPVADWSQQGPCGDEEELQDRTALIESCLLEKPSSMPDRAEVAKASSRTGILDWMLRPGDHVLTGLEALYRLPKSMWHFGDFLSIFGRTFLLGGLTGVAFFALVGAILGATFIKILVTASLLPVQVTLEKVQAAPLTAITPPLAAFMYAARSGSALGAWLGSMGHSRQIDAMKSLGIRPEEYLLSPVWWASVLAFLLSGLVFFGAMWVGAWTLCRFFLHVPQPERFLHPFGNEQFLLYGEVKLPLYGVILSTIIAKVGMAPKRNAEDVARGTTRIIILSTILVVLFELIFAFLLSVGAG